MAGRRMNRRWMLWHGMVAALVGASSGGNLAFAQTPLPPVQLEQQIELPTSIPQPSPAQPTPSATPQASPQPQPNPNRPPAQPKRPPADKFPPNPLEITELEEPDPLIPYDYRERPLTADERSEISKAADRLTIIGVTRLQQGDRVGAFAAWNQELRYRRLLADLVDEVRALGRVGDVAWTQNDTAQLRYITKRLDAIRLQTEKPGAQLEDDRNTPAELLDAKKRLQVVEALGLAYQQVRLPKIAASLYEQVVADARQRGDSLKLEATLIILGQLHLGWFDYANAAKTYQELLGRAQARQDLFNEPIYLNQLAFIHEQAKQPRQALPYLFQLVKFYQKVNDPKPVPGLIIKIADNQQLLGRLDQAEANYQLAYKTAQPLSQFADAGNALKRLGELYRANDRLPAALRMYDFLVGVEQLAYNTYGIMNAYDQQGQIHLLQKDYPEAIVAFQKGLEVARQLKLREDYFTAQIQKASQSQ